MKPLPAKAYEVTEVIGGIAHGGFPKVLKTFQAEAQYDSSKRSRIAPREKTLWKDRPAISQYRGLLPVATVPHTIGGRS